MNNRRILFLCQHFYPEMVSTGLHMTELATALAEVDSNNQIQVFCGNPVKTEFKLEGEKIEENYKGLSVKRSKTIGAQHKGLFKRVLFAFNFFFRALIYSILNYKKYDIIVLTTNPPFIGIVPLIIHFFFKKPYLLIVYDVYPDIAIKLKVLKQGSALDFLFRFLNKIIYNRASKIVVIGDDMRRIIETKLFKKKFEDIALIHNWSNKNDVFPIPKSQNLFIKKYNLESKKVLMYSGTIGTTHNIEPILGAALALNNNNDIVFFFIGSGAKKIKIQEFIKIHALKNIITLPYQPFEELNHVLSAANLSFVCLDDEFTGLSVPSKAYGIMASGVPILGLLNNASEIADTIIKFNCGLVYNKQNYQKPLSEVILSVIYDEKLIKVMGNNGKNAFEQNFDLNISASKYNSLITKILK